MFRPENVPLETQEAKLSQQYQKITGSLMVQFRGAEHTLVQMGRYLEEPDRDTRKEAWEPVANRRLVEAGDETEAARYKLYGVRLDTSSSVRDESVTPLGDPSLDLGVNPRLVFNVRQALDSAWQHWDLPQNWMERARVYCQNVKIVVSGGFAPDKIRRFEKLGVPVDIYAVGSYLFNNNGATVTDFTADVVRVKVHDQWVDMSKVGRKPLDNPNLQRVW